MLEQCSTNMDLTTEPNADFDFEIEIFDGLLVEKADFDFTVGFRKVSWAYARHLRFKD